MGNQKHQQVNARTKGHGCPFYLLDIDLDIFSNLVAVFISPFDYISNKAIPVRVYGGVVGWPVGNSI